MTFIVRCICFNKILQNTIEIQMFVLHFMLKVLKSQRWNSRILKHRNRVF